MILLSNLWLITPKKSSALEALRIGVYSNPSCTNEVYSIEWGELTPGSNREFSLFIRNDNLNKHCFLFMWTRNWKPTQASDFVFLSWDYDGESVEPNIVVHITLKMRVSVRLYGFTDFSYTMFILGADDPLPWDVTNDNYVGTDDIITVIHASESYSRYSQWNSDYDVSFDGVIDISDIVLVAEYFGESI